jgi:DNA-binding CsgD family transcriptional regulator
MEEFPSRVVEVVRKFVPCDFYAHHEFAGSIKRPIRHAVFPEYPTDVAYLAEFGQQHPFERTMFVDHLAGPFRLSDYITRREWRRTDLYNHLFRPQNQNYQLTIASRGPSVQVALALNRSTSDFTDEERQMMDLVCPHLVRAFHNNQLLSDLTMAAQAHDRGYMIVDETGRIRFSTLNARIYLEEYDDSVRNEVLPGRIRAWFLARVRWQPTVDSKPVSELVLYQQTGRLIVQFVPSPTPGEFHLALQEKREPNDPTLLQKLGLTKKEAEVLFWVSKGKRNGEIGQILGTSLRTVEKHVEHILVKLAVETRTSAGALAMDYLTSGSKVSS